MLAPAIPPLDKVEPTEAWLPWQPNETQRWDLKWAGHLYRRAAFGASLKQLREAVKEGLPATLERLLQGDPEKGGRDEALRHSTGLAVARGEEPAKLRGWWLYWMTFGSHPLREKMTLFWHNHFATSIVKVQRPELMLRQNELLHRHALGQFRPMLLEISKDPAMLIWLDSNSNVKGKPNENYAREIMELFSLGVGNYTEKDIREAARAFTGWHTDGERFAFNAEEHDGEAKAVLGQSGNLDGGDIVRILLEQAAAPRFLVRKLYRYFISETADPPDALLQPLANAFQKSDYDIATLIQTILRSRHFFSEHAYRQRIKSPVEFVLGAAHDVGRTPGADQLLVSPGALVETLNALGQTLFAPPNVKGWRYGQSWLNTATVLARANYCEALTCSKGVLNVQEKDYTRTAAITIDPAAHIRMAKLTDPVKIVDVAADMLLQGDLSEAARTKLINYLAEAKVKGGNAKPADAPPAPPDPKPPVPEPKGATIKTAPVPVGGDTVVSLDQAVRDVFHAIMTMPEYQLA